MNTILIIAFLFATKGAFLLWFGKTAVRYYDYWKQHNGVFSWPMRSVVDVTLDLLIAVAGWAWVFGSGIA